MSVCRPMHVCACVYVHACSVYCRPMYVCIGLCMYRTICVCIHVYMYVCRSRP